MKASILKDVKSLFQDFYSAYNIAPTDEDDEIAEELFNNILKLVKAVHLSDHENDDSDDEEDGSGAEEGNQSVVGEDDDGDSHDDGSEEFAVRHAPAGGVTIAGKFFDGGQFIPDEYWEQATPEERKNVIESVAADAKMWRWIPWLAKRGNGYVQVVPTVDKNGRYYWRDANGNKYAFNQVDMMDVSTGLVAAQNSPLRQHLANLKVPPNIKPLYINRDQNEFLQVVGIDENGRVHKMYNPNAANYTAAKLMRMKEISSHIDSMYHWFKRLSSPSDFSSPIRHVRHRALMSAACLFMLDTGMRIGSTSTRAKSEGVLNLTLDNIKTNSQGDLIINYVGKNGHPMKIILNRSHASYQPMLEVCRAAYNRSKLHNAPPEAKRLFPFAYRSASKYIQNLAGALFQRIPGATILKFSAHDFRRIRATTLAIQEVRKFIQQGGESIFDNAVNATEFRKLLRQVAAPVAQALGHVRVISGGRHIPDVDMTIRHYIAPYVWARWKKLRTSANVAQCPHCNAANGFADNETVVKCGDCDRSFKVQHP